MNDYSKTGKLTLSYVKKHKINVLSSSPLVISIDGDSYTTNQISSAFTEPAQDRIYRELDIMSGERISKNQGSIS